MKEGNAVPVRATVEVRFRLFPVHPTADYWYSGPMAFRLDAGLTPPVVKDGTRPKPATEISNESAVLEFTVDPSGSVKNIHSIYGSQSASEMLSRSLATWKFWPAMNGHQSVEATGTVRFFKGEGDQAAKLPLPLPPPPVRQSNPSEPEHAPEKSAPTVDLSQIRTMVNTVDGQRYVWIPPGTFTMGCSEGDTECADNERPPHTERIANGFWLGQTEVTQAAYVRVTGGNPSVHKGDQLPVESLTWNHAVNYCTAIGGRLPKDAEWEYAARAGIAWARYGSLDAVAWHPGNSSGMTHPAAMKQPNPFGLYDMLGNVWEWVEDSYAGTASKILRGGSSQAEVTNARASRRWVVDPASGPYRGFRCAGEFAEADSRAEAAGLGSLSGKPTLVNQAPNPAEPGTMGPDSVFPVGGGVSAPAVILKVEPEYSEEARKRKYGGTVMLALIVDTEGRARNIHVVKSLGMGLDEKAIEAAEKWRFKPGMKGGQPVEVRVTIEVNFRLL
jgi:TonB family protein